MRGLLQAYARGFYVLWHCTSSQNFVFTSHGYQRSPFSHGLTPFLYLVYQAWG